MITESSWDTASVWQAEMNRQIRLNDLIVQLKKFHFFYVSAEKNNLKLTHLHCIFDGRLTRLTQEQLDCENKATVSLAFPH